MKKKANENPLTREYVAALLSYNKITGVFRWKECTFKSNQWNAAWAGKEAGSLHHTGYIYIGINGRLYGAHRLAWLLVFGEWPEFEIDHKRGNRADNRISELRPASRPQNGMNRGAYKNNSSGFKGVCWHKRIKKWTARIQVGNKMVNLGYFLHPQDASAVYESKAKELFGEFKRG